MNDVFEQKKATTIIDIAKRAGVSQATVGRVIGGYGSVSEKTRESVLRIAEELNYIPNAVAQSMKKKSTNSIGVVIGNIENQFFGHLVHSIEVYAAESGYNIIISNTNENPANEKNVIQVMQSKQVDGLIIATSQPSKKKFDDLEKKLYLGNIPKVFVDREIFGIDELCVKTDHYGGAYEATNYLIGLGHTHIAVVSGLKVSTMEQRIQGCKQAFLDNSLNLNYCSIGLGDTMSIEDGARITEELVKADPKITAVFALNNLLSYGALLKLSELKLGIPEKISFVGWDDFPIAQIYQPPLTMVTQETDKIGETAIRILLEMIAQGDRWREVFPERRITMKTRLIERNSCRMI